MRFRAWQIGHRPQDLLPPGVMLAATEGAAGAGGKTTVVYYHPELASNFKGEVAANFGDESFEEANYLDGTKKLLELGDAYIVFNGGTGTVSEFAMSWGLARLYFGHHKPLLLYGDSWPGLIDEVQARLLTRPEERAVLTFVDSPASVTEALDRYEAILRKNRHDHRTCDDPECLLLLQTYCRSFFHSSNTIGRTSSK